MPMTLEKAIEIVTTETHELIPGVNDDYINALKLGAEAMKYVIYRDSCPGVNTRLLLPGETEE